jgi:hypothetical protein
MKLTTYIPRFSGEDANVCCSISTSQYVSGFGALSTWTTSNLFFFLEGAYAFYGLPRPTRTTDLVDEQTRVTRVNIRFKRKAFCKNGLLLADIRTGN